MAAKARLDLERRKRELVCDDGITKDGVGEYFNYDGKSLREIRGSPLRWRHSLDA